MKKITALFAVLFVLAGCNAAPPREVIVSNVYGTETQAYAGMEPAQGSALSTGKNTFAQFLIDGQSLVKMDENTDITVTTLAANLAALTISGGAVLADIIPRNDRDRYELRLGMTGSVVSVTDAVFIADYGNGSYRIIVLEGEIEVNGTKVREGEMYGALTVGSLPGVTPLTVNPLLSTFALNEIIERREWLVEYEILTAPDIERAWDIINSRGAAE
jgi:hypothetical protein